MFSKGIPPFRTMKSALMSFGAEKNGCLSTIPKYYFTHQNKIVFGK